MDSDLEGRENISYLKMMNEIDVEDDDDIELDEWKNYWQSSDSGSENSAEMKLKQLKATLLRIQHGVPHGHRR